MDALVAFATEFTGQVQLLRQELAALKAERQQSADDLSKCYTVQGLAARLNCHRNKVYELLAAGKIDYFCLGRKNYRFSERAVRRYEDKLPPLKTAA